MSGNRASQLLANARISLFRNWFDSGDEDKKSQRNQTKKLLTAKRISEKLIKNRGSVKTRIANLMITIMMKSILVFIIHHFERLRLLKDKTWTKKLGNNEIIKKQVNRIVILVVIPYEANKVTARIRHDRYSRSEGREIPFLSRCSVFLNFSKTYFLQKI